MFNLNKGLSYAREKKKEEERKEKEEEEKADVDLQKHYKELYKDPHSNKIKGIIIDGYLQYYCKDPHSGKKTIRIKHRKEDDIYNYGLI